MTDALTNPSERLRIVHCFRSPVGGIFRHVRDLIAEQVKLGHEVGIICDSNTGGEFEERLFEELRPSLTLGLHRLPMDRSIGPRDVSILWKLYKNIRNLKPDILHSHGAKGGAYARLIGTPLRLGSKRPARLYCPHGGSVHYDRSKLSGWIYFQLERLLERMTDRLIFVSNYERDGYFEKVGPSKCPSSLVYNGLTEEEFLPVGTNSKASDFVYVGMMRDLKGVDLFLKALPLVHQKCGQPVSALLVGDGPDLERYKQMAQTLGDGVTTRFMDPMPARQAFGLGRTLVVPSRAESMPYIVLEALAAQRPMLATRVGGIPEIYGPYAGALVQPDDLDALAVAMSAQLTGRLKLPKPQEMANRIRERFSSKVMAADVMGAYREVLDNS